MSIIIIMAAVWAALLIAWGAVALYDRLKPKIVPDLREVRWEKWLTSQSDDLQEKIMGEDWDGVVRPISAHHTIGGQSMKSLREMTLDETELHMEMDELIAEVERGL